MTDYPNLSHVNLLISSPSGDGKWEDSYVESLNKTKILLEKCQVKFDWSRALYSSDIYITRAKLFAGFYKNDDATHLLMIDADMGWNPEDVIRMLQLDRKFLAVAGPKKKYPLEFAFNMWGPDGSPMPMTQEVGTNVATNIPHVGGAFILIKREVANRMVAAYPDLEYDVSPGVTEFALFDPIILDSKIRRRLSEDYAFCHRWRKIGGKVEMLTDVRLAHTGAHTFAGSVEESLQEAETRMGLQPEIREATDVEKAA